MNIKIPVTLFLSLFSFSILAQDSLIVNPVTKTISRGTQPGFSITVSHSSERNFIRDWRQMLKKSKAEEFKKGGEFHFRVWIPEISKDTVWIYNLIDVANRNLVFYGFISTNDSIFTGTGEIASGLQRYMRNFAVDQFREDVRSQMEDEKKKLKNLEDDLEDLNKQNDSWNKNIKKNNRKIDQLRDDIATLSKEEELKGDAIFTQKQLIATYISESEQKKIEEKKLKSLMNDKKKMQSKIESLHKKTDNLDEDNKQFDRNMDMNKDNRIPDQKRIIQKQKDKIISIQEQLTRIH